MLNLPAELTQEQATNCLMDLTQGVSGPEPEVVVDAQSLKRFDSSAIAVLLALRRECARAGKTFSVKGLPERLRDLAVLYGVEKLLFGV